MESAAATTTINGETYRIGRLTPKKSFHVARRLAPFLGAVVPHLRALFARNEDGTTPDTSMLGARGAALIPDIADTLARMSNEDCDYILDTCLGVVELKQERGWAPVMTSAGQMMFEQINTVVMMQLVMEVVKVNLSDFFPTNLLPNATETAGATATTQ
jgi:hypothetical protein